MRAVSILSIVFVACVFGQGYRPTVVPPSSFAAQIFQQSSIPDYGKRSGMLYHDGKGKIASKVEDDMGDFGSWKEEEYSLLQADGTSIVYSNGTNGCTYRAAEKNKINYDLFSWILNEKVYFIPAGGEDYQGYPCDLWKRPNTSGKPGAGKFIETVCVSQWDPTVPAFHEQSEWNIKTFFLAFKPTTSFDNAFQPPQGCRPSNF
ncbi:hypothetical protein PROFUN_01473 [Planoprotostelium fungivorum]|uniref:Uncharacterized protein n=1 Tax=Planoprotostelium fungivorum TaxID=1890364 RepID=A0A2P6NTE1_9EUKA|nr:hypothetical protein PROFUN_01473 [Planoprotostelium fungivorum]